MTKHVIANGTREDVDIASQRIAKVLHERGEMGLELLKEETRFESHIFNWAVGWLIRDDAIDVIGNGGSYSLRRKEPDTSKPILI